MISINTPNIFERAFELADRGLGVSAIRETLKHEGYEAFHISGRSISKQLSARAKTARSAV
jgi:hypothetical protein